MNPHLAALSGALMRWDACRPGPQSDAWARQVAAALRALLAEGWAVIDPPCGALFLVPLARAATPVPRRLLRIAQLPGLPLPLAEAPASDGAAGPPADGPLTADELIALSRLGWEVVPSEGAGGPVRMVDMHDPERYEEARSPGGWRALL